MHTRIPPMFKVSVLTAAIVALSGCAATKEPSLIGEAIVGAGQVTASTSIKAYEGTKRLFGFDSDEGGLDDTEVDLALMDADETWPAEQPLSATALPVQISKAQKIETLSPRSDVPLDVPAIARTPAIDPNAIPVATADLNHVVGPNETMWTIAKLTTGDANNWRILAEINQLDLNTPMSIGQEIIIPADLVLPQIVSAGANDINVLEESPTLADLAPLNLEIDNLGVGDQIPAPISQESLASDPLGGDINNNAELNDVIEEVVMDELELAEANTAAAPELVPAVDPTLNAVALEADFGETLWDMAKRTTGDATNWKLIAAQNGFTEKDIGRIRYGQTIYVPVDLAKAELGGDNVIVANAELPETDAAATDNLASATTNNTMDAADKAIAASAALVASANDLLDEAQDIKIVEATFQSDETLQVEKEIASATDQIIMVSGTYYPKAVYNEADFSSSLLMRVSPGTELTVSRALGPWFEVQTEFGKGYMHSRDIK